MATKEQINDIIETLDSLHDDSGIPKNIKNKVNEIIVILKGDTDISIRINKVLDKLDDIANDANLDPFVRTQIWNVVSALENST